jgi:hypothetical protein
MNIRPSPAGAETDTRPFVLAFAGYVWGKAERLKIPRFADLLTSGRGAATLAKLEPVAPFCCSQRAVRGRRRPLCRPADRSCDHRWSALLRVSRVLDSVAPLAEMRAALADAGPGRGQIRLIPWLGDAREVEIALPSAWRISGALVGRLQAIPGIRDVREV